MSLKFGTDGIRAPFSAETGAESEGYLTPATAFRVGAAAVEVLGLENFVLVSDTRSFNPELAEELIRGVTSRGGFVDNLGILPTPAAALVASELSPENEDVYGAFSLSASHNPAHDAGIKVFGAAGRKLDDEVSARIAEVAERVRPARLTDPYRRVKPIVNEYNRELYLSILGGSVKGVERDFLTGQTIVVDAANGAAHWSAPEILRRFGANVIEIFTDPTGEINKDCGATQPNPMIKAVLASGASYGMSLDGDADRLIAYSSDVWGEGRLLSGDDALVIAAKDLMATWRDFSQNVVVTDYSSVGFKRQMDSMGINTHFAANGDRYVADLMDEVNAPYGAEVAGHILLGKVLRSMGLTVTGDGTMAALHQLAKQARLGRSLCRISDFPRLGYARSDFSLKPGQNAKQMVEHPAINEVAKVVEHLLGRDGKILVRGSGTEPVIRALVKTGHDQAVADFVMEELEQAIAEVVGTTL